MSNYLVTYANLFKQHYLNPFLFDSLRHCPRTYLTLEEVWWWPWRSCWVQVLLRVRVFPPLSNPLLALMINVKFARECAIVFELIGLLLSSRRGVFFSLRDQQCVLYSCASYYQRTTSCHRNKTTELRRTLLLISVPCQNGKERL